MLHNIRIVIMSGLIQFPHSLQKTLEVVHWFHLHPEECKEAMEVFFTSDNVHYRLVGEAFQMSLKTPSVYLVDHQYEEGGEKLRPQVEGEFREAIASLLHLGNTFQTCTYRQAPRLTPAFIWSIEKAD